MELAFVSLLLYGLIAAMIFVVSKAMVDTRMFGEKITAKDDISKVEQVRNVFVISLGVTWFIELLILIFQGTTKLYMTGVVISLLIGFVRFWQLYRENPKCISSIKMAQSVFVIVVLTILNKAIDIFK